MAQGTLYVECFQQLLNGLVFEFISAVCMEQADNFQAFFHALEGFFYKPCCFMFLSALPYDLPVKKVNKYTYVISAFTHPYIHQIAYHYILVFPILELALPNVFCF